MAKITMTAEQVQERVNKAQAVTTFSGYTFGPSFIKKPTRAFFFCPGLSVACPCFVRETACLGPKTAKCSRFCSQMYAEYRRKAINKRYRSIKSDFTVLIRPKKVAVGGNVQEQEKRLNQQWFSPFLFGYDWRHLELS